MKLFTQWKKHVFFNTQINTYGCVHDCVCVCVFLSRIYFYSIIILCNQKQITNSRRAGDRQNGRKWEWQHTSMRISTTKCAPLFTEAAVRQSRRTVPHGHLLNYSLRRGREERGRRTAKPNVPIIKTWLTLQKVGGAKENQRRRGKTFGSILQAIFLYEQTQICDRLSNSICLAENHNLKEQKCAK